MQFDSIVQIIKLHEKAPEYIRKAREYSKELCALVNGEGFDETLQRIEHLESDNKLKSRKKYSRDIRDLFQRLSNPISNIFTSTGGATKYDIQNETQYKEFLNIISNIRDGKSLRKFLQEIWLDLYHTDPNGVIFLEYKDARTYPTYKSIDNIRGYELNGQAVIWILFESKELENGDTLWRFVDEDKDYTIIQSGEFFKLDEETTFDNPFGKCPAVVNSNIVDIKKGIRLSPYDKIIPLAREFARDQSIKTLYKFAHGFPLHWRYVSQCRVCTGVGKIDGKDCGSCDGHGYHKRSDVTDMVTLPIPEGDDHNIAPNIAGFISPDLDTWNQYTSELELLEITATDTHWGTHKEKGGKSSETATGRFIDTQPVMNKLNDYADVTEYIEWSLTELVANFSIPTKGKNKNIALITYGRRYIIESPDVILENYNKAKQSNANITTLDRLYNEFITSKYINDPEWLKMELEKAEIEPYLHLSIREVFDIFGTIEAQRKDYFGKWWHENINFNGDKKLKFEQDFELIKTKKEKEDGTLQIN